MTDLLPYLQLILTAGNVCILGYTLIKFLGKPHNSLDERIKALESWKEETDRRLEKGTKKLQDHDDTNEIILKSVLALIEFEMEYCTTEHKSVSPSLEKAKNELHDYLTQR